MRRLCSAVCLAAGCACVALAASPAVATPTPQSSAPQQYVEVLPGAGGAVAPLAGGAASAAQQYVEQIPSANGGVGAVPLRVPAGAAGSGSALGVAVSAVASGDEWHVVGLVAAMVVATLWLVLATASRLRRRAAAERREDD
jgi:hypothetical protein